MYGLNVGVSTTVLDRSPELQQCRHIAGVSSVLPLGVFADSVFYWSRFVNAIDSWAGSKAAVYNPFLPPLQQLCNQSSEIA
jgi:hypothetical protein